MIIFFILFFGASSCFAMDSMPEPIATLDDIAHEIMRVTSESEACIKRVIVASQNQTWLIIGFKPGAGILESIISNYEKIDPNWMIVDKYPLQGIIKYQIPNANLGLKLLERYYEYEDREAVIQAYKDDIAQTEQRDKLFEAKFANDSSVCLIL